MIEHFENLDQAIEFILEKSGQKTTSNPRHLMASALHTQEDYDQHVDAMAHHAGAIMHYREKPAVKAWSKLVSEQIVPHRAYVTSPIKLSNAKAPLISMHHLNHEHDELKGMDDTHKQAKVDELNKWITAAHTAFHKNKDIQRLHSHSNRFLAHFVAAMEHHNAERSGHTADANFAGHVHAPEFTDRPQKITDSKYRHSSHFGNGVYTTQSVTKNGGAMWDPGLPELTSLKENSNHASAGQMKELYPFHEIKINGEPLKLKSFEGTDPDEIHDKDRDTNLTVDHKVRNADGEIVSAMGGYHGSKTSSDQTEAMKRTGFIKKSDEPVSDYFPDATLTHIVLAENLIKVLNPYAGMTDEEFGEYVASATSRSIGPSEQAAIIVESRSRLEKSAKISAKTPDKSERTSSARSREREHAQGVASVLSGKILPLPITKAGTRTTKDSANPDMKEKRNEVEDLEQLHGTKMKRSPYVVPDHVFTDESMSAIDPEKYKEWVHGEPTEQDIRDAHATYIETIRHNPEAQKAHRAFIESHKQMIRENERSRMAQDDDHDEYDDSKKVDYNPVVSHQSRVAKAKADLKAGKISPEEFHKQVMGSMETKAKNVTHAAKEEERTPTENAIKELDPEYKVMRPSATAKAVKHSEKELTDIAVTGRVPQHLQDLEEQEDADTEHEKQVRSMTGKGQAKEIASGGMSADEDGEGGGQHIRENPLPQTLVSKHPGYKAYLQLKEKLLSHYKDPAVRTYMEQRINKIENNKNLDVDKLAAEYHFQHKSFARAQGAAKGADKLGGEIARDWDKEPGDTGPDEAPGKGSALAPESMMTPEQRERFAQVKQEKASASGEQAPTIGGDVPPERLKADSDRKKQVMAEIQAREDAKRAKARSPK